MATRALAELAPPRIPPAPAPAPAQVNLFSGQPEIEPVQLELELPEPPPRPATEEPLSPLPKTPRSFMSPASASCWAKRASGWW